MNKPPRPIRVLIADDHALIRKGLQVALEDAPGIQVVGEAQNGAEVQQLVTERRPHVLLLDLIMPDTQTPKVAAWVRDHFPDTVILVLTGYDRCDYLSDMIEIGIAGYIDKSTVEPVIVDAIWRAVRGESLITKEQMARVHDWHKKVDQPWESLTWRERQVLRLIADTQSNKQIAESLGISERTVETHVGNLLNKLDVESRAQAASWFWQHGLDRKMECSE